MSERERKERVADIRRRIQDVLRTTSDLELTRLLLDVDDVFDEPPEAE